MDGAHRDDAVPCSTIRKEILYRSEWASEIFRAHTRSCNGAGGEYRLGLRRPADRRVHRSNDSDRDCVVFPGTFGLNNPLSATFGQADPMELTNGPT